MIQIVHVNIFYHKKLQKMFHVPRSCISYDTCSILLKLCLIFKIYNKTSSVSAIANGMGNLQYKMTFKTTDIIKQFSEHS